MAQQLLYTTVPISVIDGGGRLLSTATASLFAHPSPDGKSFPLLVTNRHVLRNADTVSIVFTEAMNGAPVVGSRIQITIQNVQKSVTFHPKELIDVAVLPIGNCVNAVREEGRDVYVRSIPTEMAPKAEQVDEFSAIEEVTFIGYPVGVWDEVNLLPVVRRGITATPLFVDFKGEPVFLIDASVFPGSSGSPVFFYQHGFHTDRQGNSKLTLNRALFLGIVAACYLDDVLDSNGLCSGSLLSRISETPTAGYKHPADLGIVYKATTVLETVISATSKWSPG